MAPTPLISPARKEELLHFAGADHVLIYRSTPELFSLTAEQFFEEILIRRLAVRGLVEGSNFGFGRGRLGDVALLGRLAGAAEIPLEVVDLAQAGEGNISSSRARQLLAEGDVAGAVRILGRPHRLEGTVAKGDGRGRTIGFPTANLAEVAVAIPAPGVYAGRALVEGRPYAAACNIGPNPTFGVDALKVEIHLIGFAGDLYGRRLAVDLIQRVRSTKKFSSASELRARIEQDAEQSAALAFSQPITDDARATLCLTISEWLAGELGLSGAGVVETKLSDDGSLSIEGLASASLLPHQSFDAALALEDRLRRVFPEVRSISSPSPSRSRR